VTVTQPLNLDTTSNSWHSLKPIWSGDKEAIQEGLPHEQLSPTWQMLLLGDGSPTHDGAPEEIKFISDPQLRRQVWLRTSSGQRLAYAASWWNGSIVDDYLQNPSLPVWRSLGDLHTELYRDVRGIYCGHCPELETAFGQKAPFWGRHYLFWHDRQPLTLIYEVFSPYLQKYLGQMIQKTE
jgi:chorismate lyase